MAHLQGAEMNRMNPAAQADTNNFHNMVPIPYHKRAIRMIKSYLIVGIPILMLTIVALSLLYWIHPIPSPAEQAQNDQMKMLSSSGNKLIDPRYYQDLTDIQIEMIDKVSSNSVKTILLRIKQNEGLRQVIIGCLISYYS